MGIGSASFGVTLRRLRIAAALSQEELASRAGLSLRGVSDLERGERRAPHLATVRLLADALALGPEDRQALLAASRPSASSETPSPPTPGAARLPRPMTPLIGRERELAELSALLEQHATCLVTVTGPGGSGKTRLALEVGDRLQARFAGGMAFVDLAPVTDHALVLPTIASALGVRERAGQRLLDTLAAVLIRTRMAILLDNCEHLLVAAPDVAALFTAVPVLTVLATSREPLRLRGERVYPLLPLQLPDEDTHSGLDELAGVPAVALFVERARAADPAFVLAAENARAVAGICRRLDGLPLALELAAARVRLLPPEALLARLQQALPLLTGGSRDLPVRQQTLRGAIAWSHDLLSEGERALYRRLSAFTGGWTLEAAEAVANPDETLDVLDGMASLLDKSLVRQVDTEYGEPRFTMLETIREFALDQLKRHPSEEEAVRTSHAAYYADLALGACAGLRCGLPSAMQQMRAEQDNLRAMLARLLDNGDAETALRVAGSSLNVYWTIAGGQFGEGRDWLDRALRAGERASPAARAWGQNGAAWLALFQGDVATARKAAIACQSLAHGSDDPHLAITSPLVLCAVEDAAGRIDAAVPLAVQSVTAARALHDPCCLGWALWTLGTVQWRASNLGEATIALEEALAIYQELGSYWGQADTLMILANVARSDGDLARASRLQADALRARLDFGEMVGIYDDLVGLAAIAQAAGRFDSAARLLGAEETFRAFSGYEGYGVTPALREQTRQALVEHLGDASFEQAWDAGKGLSTKRAIAEALALAEELAVASPGR